MSWSVRKLVLVTTILGKLLFQTPHGGCPVASRLLGGFLDWCLYVKLHSYLVATLATVTSAGNRMITSEVSFY